MDPVAYPCPRPPVSVARSLLRALRPHQWVKNVLVFVPMVMAHRLFDPALWGAAAAAFAALSLLASGTYVINDLLDVEQDRLHPAKRHRPFASGALSAATGKIAAPLLIGAGLALGFAASAAFGLVLLVYLATTLAYSLDLKRRAVLDVVVLAGLYVVRVMAGGAAADVPVSGWLLAFSMFFFLSLAFAKRFAELRLIESGAAGANARRGYAVGDAPLLAAAGLATGYLAVLVLALYTTSPEVVALYARPQLLWLIGPLLLYWITRLWLTAQRGHLDDDPILYAAKDPASYAVGALTAATLLAASL